MSCGCSGKMDETKECPMKKQARHTNALLLSIVGAGVATYVYDIPLAFSFLASYVAAGVLS